MTGPGRNSFTQISGFIFFALLSSWVYWKGFKSAPQSYSNTSMTDALEHPLRRNTTTRPIYDLSYIAYTSEFARQYGLQLELVARLSPGLHYFQIKAVTEGNATRCRATLALDKSLTLMLGKDDRLNSMLASVELPFSDKAQPSQPRSSQQKLAAHQLNSFPHKSLNDYNGLIKLGANGVNAKVFLQYYLTSRSDQINIISMSGLCDYWLPVLAKHDAAIFLAQPGSNEPLPIPIPVRLRESIAQALSGQQLSD